MGSNTEQSLYIYRSRYSLPTKSGYSNFTTAGTINRASCFGSLSTFGKWSILVSHFLASLLSSLFYEARLCYTLLEAAALLLLIITRGRHPNCATSINTSEIQISSTFLLNFVFTIINFLILMYIYTGHCKLGWLSFFRISQIHMRYSQPLMSVQMICMQYIHYVSHHHSTNISQTKLNKAIYKISCASLMLQSHI